MSFPAFLENLASANEDTRNQARKALKEAVDSAVKEYNRQAPGRTQTEGSSAGEIVSQEDTEADEFKNDFDQAFAKGSESAVLKAQAGKGSSETLKGKAKGAYQWVTGAPVLSKLIAKQLDADSTQSQQALIQVSKALDKGDEQALQAVKPEKNARTMRNTSSLPPIDEGSVFNEDAGKMPDYVRVGYQKHPDNPYDLNPDGKEYLAGLALEKENRQRANGIKVALRRLQYKPGEDSTMKEYVDNIPEILTAEQAKEYETVIGQLEGVKRQQGLISDASNKVRRELWGGKTKADIADPLDFSVP